MGNPKASLLSTIIAHSDRGSTIFGIYSIVDPSMKVGEEEGSATVISKEGIEGGVNSVS